MEVFIHPKHSSFQVLNVLMSSNWVEPMTPGLAVTSCNGKQQKVAWSRVIYAIQSAQRWWRWWLQYYLLDVFQLSGMIYRNDVLHMQSWLRVPSPVSTLAGHSLGRLFYTPCPTDLQSPMGATLELQRLQHVERLEQQMVWAQLARQAQPPAAQVTVAAFYPSSQDFPVLLF